MPQEVREHQSQAERIETLIQEVAAFHDPHARTKAEELVQALLNMYGEGLSRLLELTAETEASGLALIDTFASDELLSSLFMLHGLHPIDIETRVLEALDECAALSQVTWRQCRVHQGRSRHSLSAS